MIKKIKKYFSKNKKEVLMVVLILLVASFMRLYKISDYMTFLGDEGRDAIVAKEILSGNFTLLGPRASAGDFFLGPIYYYMIAPFLFLSNYDPVGPAVMVAIFGVATVFLVYFFGKKLFDIKTGLIASSLYSISPVVVAYSRSSWNPNLMPFISLLIVYLTYLAVKKNSITLFWTIGILFGIAMQLHYLTVFLGVIIFVFILISQIIQKNKETALNLLKQYSLIFFGFILGLTPFLAFEVRHGFPNIKAIFSFIFEDNATSNYLPHKSFVGQILDVFFRLYARLVGKYPDPSLVKISEDPLLSFWYVGILILAIASILILLKRKDWLKVSLIGCYLIIGIGLFGIYKKPIYDYYFGFMFPLPFLLVGNLISEISNFNKYQIAKIVAFILFLGLMLLNISGNPFQYAPNRQKEQAKNTALFVLEQTEGKPFNFALLADGNSDHVYRYFFEIEDRAPITIINVNDDPQRTSVTDQLLIICERSDCKPLGDPLWEVAGFGRAEIEATWTVQHMTIFKLVHFNNQE